ncbi:MAG: MCE family protein [Actinomycetota bacterium]|nr:MCE family protein [Actinomycetota bacterium]
MITRRIVVNLVTFFVASAVLIGFGLVDLLGNPFVAPTVVDTVLPNADGLYPGFSVTLDGVPVGSVRSVHLARGGVVVAMALQPGARVPGDVAARVEVANPLGEQQIDLVPQHGGHAPPLVAGDRVPVAPGGDPADIGQVVATATRLLAAIPVGDLNTVLHQAAVALDGRAGAIRALIDDGQQFAQEFLAYRQQFRTLLADAPPVLDAVTAAGPQLRDALANTATLLGVLADHQQAVLSLFRSGASASQLLDALVVRERPNLGCLVHDLGATTANLAEPANLGSLAGALATNGQFFAIVDALTPSGPARSLRAGQPASTSQVWLRTRLLIPPVLSPAAVTYARPRSLPAILPAAACQTEFGAGVAAASQPGFVPEAPGVTVEPPTPAEAQVRGSGTAPADPTQAPPTQPAGNGSPSGPVLPAMGSAAVLAAGPIRRRARPARPVPTQVPRPMRRPVHEEVSDA